MLSNYFKIAWRNLLRNKGLFFINTTGLTLGIATCLLILLFVAEELSYDRFHQNADQIVRVVLKGTVNGEDIKEAVTPAPVAPTMKAEFPEVLEYTRIRKFGNAKITHGEHTFRNSRLAFADPAFFQVFSFPFIKGDPEKSLAEPNTLVLTESEATKLFGSEDPIDKLLKIDHIDVPFRVTGVIRNLPSNSHFHFDIFASLEGVPHARENNWLASNYYSYLLLAEGTDQKAFESKFPAIIKKYMGPQVEQLGMTFEKFTEIGNQIGLYVQPLTDIHLHSDFDSTSEIEAGGDIQKVYIFGAVALFMLLIACINFINLTTAGATKRNKEVGVKKVLGSSRSHLIFRFLSESFLLTSVAIVLAALVVALALPTFNQLSGKNLEFVSLLTPQVLGMLLLLVLTITIMAGSYPAFFLSSIKPIAALKNRANPVGRSLGIRRALVVFQFVVSTGLILAIIIINQQMSFIQNKSLGYDREQMLVLRQSYLLGKHEHVFRNQIQNDSRVESVTMSAFVPAGPTDNNMTTVYPGERQEEIRRTIVYNIDTRYLATMGMKLVAGKNFQDGMGLDSTHVIINETAVKILGLGDDPVGQELAVNVGSDDAFKKVTLLGVVQDFHFRSLREPIAPLIMMHMPYGGLIVRCHTSKMAGLIADLEQKWNAFDTGEPFTYALLDQLYNETYLAEQKMGTIIKIFGMITILVACLGLFGLVTFSAEQRVKEIGIRKVLGAGVSEIVTLLSREMIILVVVSFLIAFPLGYYLMNNWLQDFAYKTEVHWWVFALAGFLTLGFAFLTMSFKTIESARLNPVDSLRAE